MTTVCRACPQPTDAYLCKHCTRKLEQAIAELPADLADLQLVATRQATGPLGLGDRGQQWDGPFEEGALGDAPWEFAPGPADQIWVTANTITTWARHLAESRGIEPPQATRGTHATLRELYIERNRMHIRTWRVFTPTRDQPLTPVIGWLLRNINAIRYDEAAEQIFEELTGLHAENEQWILGRSGVEQFAGRCNSAQVTFELDPDGALRPVAATCGANLFGREGEAEVRCKTCGMRYPLADRIADVHQRQINDQLARAHVIADALTTLENPLGRDLLRKWIQRDALLPARQEGPACVQCQHPTCKAIRRPPIHPRGVDDDGHPLYRVGDVRRRLAVVQEQRGIRLSA